MIDNIPPNEKKEQIQWLIIILFLWIGGMIVAWQTNRIAELLIVSILVIIFIIIVARDGLMIAKKIEKPLCKEILVNLPFDDAFAECINSLSTIHGDIDSSSKEQGIIVAIPVGVPVFYRYALIDGPYFIHDRISFDLKKVSGTTTRIIIKHNLEKASSFKLQKEEEKMDKIISHLQQWKINIS